MSCGEEPLYKDDLKCCTYYPFLPNYQVGEILLFNQGAAQLIKQYLRTKKFIFPIGLCAPESYQFKFKNKPETAFGNQEDLLCPFYIKGSCRIWQQRSSECLSFQCYSSRGERGLAFWDKIGSVIHAIELFLSQELMLDMGYFWPEVESCLEKIKQSSFVPTSANKDFLSDQQFKRSWSHHLGRIDNYFIECYKRSRQVNVQDYLKTLPSFKILENYQKELS